MMNQCGACGLDIYEYDIVHCLDHDEDVHTDCMKACVQCGHEGCTRCMFVIDDEWLCGRTCLEERYEERYEEDILPTKPEAHLEELAKKLGITGELSDLTNYLNARQETRQV